MLLKMGGKQKWKENEERQHENYVENPKIRDEKAMVGLRIVMSLSLKDVVYPFLENRIYTVSFVHFVSFL